LKLHDDLIQVLIITFFLFLFKVSWNCKEHSQPLLPINFSHPKDYIHDKTRNIESLDLEEAHSRYSLPSPASNNVTNLTFPKIPRVSGQKLLRRNSSTLEIIDLEKLRTEQMESITPDDNEQSDCHVSITKSVHQLPFNNDDDEGVIDDDFLTKNTLSNGTLGTTSSVHNNHSGPLILLQNVPNDLSYETNNAYARATTLSNRGRAKLSLPSLMDYGMHCHTVHEVPSITICQDEEARTSKATRQDVPLDPRFLMPTEVSRLILTRCFTLQLRKLA